MSERFKFNRLELAGSLGDLGTLLPIAIALVLVSGLDPLGVFLSVGVFYVLTGLYFGVTVPVQPMKVIGAYAIAKAMQAPEILSAGLLMAVCLAIVGLTGAIEGIRRCTPKAVVRGIQLSTGVLLINAGVQFMLGTTALQKAEGLAEPALAWQALGPIAIGPIPIGPIPIGLIIGGIGVLATLWFLNSKRFPAGLIVVCGGAVLGLLLGTHAELRGVQLGFNLPQFLPIRFPQDTDVTAVFTFALLALVLPQIPMTIGNAVFAYTDLSREYFAERSARVTNRAVCLSMALANLVSFCLGGMPLCHGAGGLAAHHRFGARTAGSNLMIGAIFIVLALTLGPHIVDVLSVLPLSILGVLLVFAGCELAIAVRDLDSRKDYFVVMLMLGITLAANLAAGFIVGIVVAHLLRWRRLAV